MNWNGIMQADKKKAVIWNTAAGIINAGQSAIILIFISHKLGTEAAGVFTIAYALANLFSTIGKFGVRNYQVTDFEKKYKFCDYVAMRVLTIAIAILIIAVYIIIKYFGGNYDFEKISVIILMSLWKMVDAVEDVFYGMYQQYDRLDVGSRCYCVRLLISTVGYCIAIVMGSSLCMATLITVILSIIVALCMIISTWKQFDVDLFGAKFNDIKLLFLDCIPLCIGTSLSIYVGNIPKYLIDAYMDETVQAYFGFLMMPAFVILILGSFIYQPLVRNFGEMLANQERKKIIKYLVVISLVILSFTVLVVLVGRQIGLPVLSWLYGVDLLSYKKEFIVLLVGGGIYALVSFYVIPLTSIREQKSIAIGFIIVTVFSYISGEWIIDSYGMMGAVILYLVQNVFLAIIFFVRFIVRIRYIEQQNIVESM